MAETYSEQYQALYITKPPAKTQRMGVADKGVWFSYSQVLAGAAGDTILLAQLPPFSMLDLIRSWVSGEGMTAGATFSLGWQSYTDIDGVVQAASATGLYNVADVTNSTWVVRGGMQATDAGGGPDDQIPVIASRLKDFRNVTPVTLYATIGTQAPGVNCELRGVFVYYNVG
jgi:hypothetical protein